MEERTHAVVFDVGCFVTLIIGMICAAYILTHTPK